MLFVLDGKHFVGIMDAEDGDGGGDVIAEIADKKNRTNGKAATPTIAEEIETIKHDGRKSGKKLQHYIILCSACYKIKTKYSFFINDIFKC